MSKKQTVFAIVFVFVWWLPVVLSAMGIPAGRFMPLPLPFLHKIATLFAFRQDPWLVHYVEVRYPGNENWHPIPEDAIFGSTMFGHRSRMQRLLDQAHERPEAGMRLREEMAQWIAGRMNSSPEGRPSAVRFLDATYVPKEHSETPSYVAPKLEDYPPERIDLVSVHSLERQMK